MSYTDDRKTVCVNERPDILGKRIILCLAKNNETLDRNDIAERIGNPFQTVKYVLEKKLEDDGIIEKLFITKEIGRGKGKTKSHTQGYKLLECIDVFIKILSKDFDYFEFKELYRSAYSQNMINAEFVKYIKSKWNYPNDDSIRQRYLTLLDFHQKKGECLEITQEKCLEMANKHIKGLKPRIFGDKVPFPYLSDDELLFILRSSFSAFKFSFNGSSPTDEELSKLREDVSLFTNCVFSWENVPGQDSNIIIEFLEAAGVDWVKNAEIKKSSDNKEIIISKGGKSLSFKLKEGKTKVKINKKSYVLYCKEVKKGYTVASFLQTDPHALDNNSLHKIFNKLPDFLKERNFPLIKGLIPNQLFTEQIILNFISDVRLGYFFAQQFYSTELKVELKVQMSLNGQEMIRKEISYETYNSY